MVRQHTHPCDQCGEPFPCDGTFTANYDGWPDAICDLFHEHELRTCDRCRERMADDMAVS